MPDNRPSKHEYWLDILDGVKARSTCPRRHTAAIIVDSRNFLLSSGYNGSPIGVPNCIDVPCGGERQQSGDTSLCIAVHAEQNAIIQAGDRLKYADRMYCTTRPCFTCSKLICQTGIRIIYYREDYPDDMSDFLFLKAGIRLVKR